MTTDELTWAAPDGGHWQWAGSHVPHAPTPIYAAIHIHALPTGVAKVYERYGVPLATNPEVLINGRIFMSTQPLVGKPGSPPPPAPILWLASRLHPVLRRRARTAARAVEDRIWRERTEAWHAEIRPNLRRTNLLLQAEDPGSFDGEQLADHLRRLHQHVVDSHVLHFELHGDDMGPLGLFLAVCRDWGIDPGDAIAALTGHSPSTTAAVEALRKVAVAVDATGRRAPADRPTTLDGLRRLGPGVAAALDEYLEEFGWRVVTGYDLDARTVAEMPEVLLGNVWSLPAAGTDRHVERAGET
ncbi:MAG: hypothetical protein M3Z03_10980, partial [Actinomycetota bacterium]|nr:hypothetical protein [Actinomycetota bacterium]